MRKFGLFFLVIISCNMLPAQEIGFPNDLMTRPERTNYEETSLHTDVLRFVESLCSNSDLARWEAMGTSDGGKVLPLVILANPMVNTLEEAKSSNKAIIYLQGNIHGGEVEGKEALMVLMREIAFGTKTQLLDNQILLMCPLFNPDGNDNLGRNNRPNQDSSPYMAGKRTNGLGFDLNRDGLKLETAEGKALASQVMDRWDPDMFVDLHTTNGTWHGYEITYAPGLATVGHPGTETFMNDVLLPWVTDRLRERTGFETFFYGSFYEYPPKQYYGMYPEPRFWTNSFALKNKLSLLVETFSHDHFEKRILSNIHFVSTLLEYTNGNASEITNLLEQVNQDVIAEIQNSSGELEKGTSFTYKSPPLSKDFYVYALNNGRMGHQKAWFPGVNIFLDMAPEKTAKVPKAYVFPAEMETLASKLQDHGVEMHQLESSQTFIGQTYEVSQLIKDTRPYQGHYPAQVLGEFAESENTFPAGSWYVDMAQELAYLIFYLLEPEADDGLVFWNYFDQYLEDHGVANSIVDFPVFKIFQTGSGISPDERQSFELFLNEEEGVLRLTNLPIAASSKNVEVINSQGQILQHEEIPIGTVHYELRLADYPLGLYFVRIKFDEKVSTKKMMIRLLE